MSKAELKEGTGTADKIREIRDSDQTRSEMKKKFMATSGYIRLRKGTRENMKVE